MEDLNKTHTVRLMLGRSKRDYEEWLNSLPDSNDSIRISAYLGEPLIESYRRYRNLSVEGGKNLPTGATKEDVLEWWRWGNENNFGINGPVVFDGDE